MAELATASAAPPALSHLLDGTNYRAIARLGSGSMGEVLEAEHVTLNRRVVVKLLLPAFAEDAAMADRLRLEAQAAAGLAGHPNIVEVVDFGRTPGGRPYLVMERLVGRTLRQELRARGPWPVAEAIGLARQLLCGLGAAHRAGLVHRDIKPDNLLLCDRGADGQRRLKILDFGIVKVSRGRGPAPLALPTAEGMAIGTPRFLAPEQAKGGPIDSRADLYAAGCVLFWMLTGRDPFQHHVGLFPLLHAHVNEPPRPPSAAARQPISAALDRVVLRALAKKPEDRFCNAEAMMAALDALSRTSAPQRWAQTERIETRAHRAQAVGPDDETVRPLPSPLESRPERRDRIALELPTVTASPTTPAVIAAPQFRREPHLVMAIALIVVALVAFALLLYTYLHGLHS
jgi:serine/threonine protein kinase